jgi:hypothetical protein
MTSARCSFVHAEHGPITYPLTRIAWTFFRIAPVDDVVAAEVAEWAYVVEDRIVPVRVLHEVDLLPAALLARVTLFADARATEHRPDTRSRFT